MSNAQLVAAECVVDAEIKDHANWELIGGGRTGAFRRPGPSPPGCLRAGGRGGRRAPLPHPGVGERALVGVAGPDGRSASAGGAEEGEDSDRGSRAKQSREDYID